jgi:hypothetical protein
MINPKAWIYRPVYDLPVHDLSDEIIADMQYLMPGSGDPVNTDNAYGIDRWFGRGQQYWNNGQTTDHHINDSANPINVTFRSIGKHGSGTAVQSNRWDGTTGTTPLWGYLPSSNSNVLARNANATSTGSVDSHVHVLPRREPFVSEAWQFRTEIVGGPFVVNNLINWSKHDLTPPFQRAQYNSSPTGSTATKAPMTAMLAFYDEIERGICRHMLWSSVHNVVEGSFDWPARASDSSIAPDKRDATYLKEGMVLRLKKSIDIESLDVHPHVKAILRTAKTYGVFIGDINSKASWTIGNSYADPRFPNASVYRSYADKDAIGITDFEVVQFEENVRANTFSVDLEANFT